MTETYNDIDYTDYINKLTYEEYCDSLKESLNTEFFDRKYPTYYDLAHKYGLDLPVQIVLHFLNNGLNPTDGLNTFIKTIMAGPRYAKDLEQSIKKIVLLFHNNRAQFNPASLFAHKLPLTKNYFEEEVYYYSTKGMLIDILCNYYPESITNYTNWKIVEANYWEDIMIDTHDYNTALLQALKYESKFLQSL